MKQIAVHGGTRTGAPKVIADFAKYVIGKGSTASQDDKDPE